PPTGSASSPTARPTGPGRRRRGPGTSSGRLYSDRARKSDSRDAIRAASQDGKHFALHRVVMTGVLGRAFMPRETADRPRAGWRLAVALCGVAFLVWLIMEIGPSQVAASFRTLSWRLAIVVVFPCVVLKTLDILAWQLTFPHEHVPLPPLATALL